MLTVGTSLAKDLTPCPVDMLPIQIIRADGYEEVTTLSDAKDYDSPPGFAVFVRSVTEHLHIKLAQENLCLSRNESKESSLLQFVSWAVTHSEERSPAIVPPLEARPYSVCRITSPWLDLAIERKPEPVIRGIGSL